MLVKEILNKIENGSAHALLFEQETGVVILSTIWYNEIPDQYLDMNVDSICVRDYEIRLGIS